VRVDEHTINLDESPVFYRSSSETPDVPVLYLHGIPTSSDDWVEFLDRTGGIAPDLVGFGRSGKGGHLDYSLAGLTGFVERFLAELGVDAVRLVANDWGVAIGLALARRHPERVQRLVALNAPPLFDGFALPRLTRWWRAPLIGEGLMGSTTRGMLARTLRHGSVREDAWPDARVATVWDQFDQGTQRAILRLVRSAPEGSGDGGGGDPRGSSGGVGAGEPGGSGAAGAGAGEPGGSGPTGAGAGEPGSNPMPALILWGDRDPWYPPALADAYAARLSGARVERLADAGHWPWLDRTDLIERVATFLEE
jgi:pimeloyl-ACP methyl ester carboxylesterase